MTAQRTQTLEGLRLALLRLQKGRPRTVDPERKLSIAAVAEEAGVSAATIHNRYPEIADQIRRLLDKDTRRQRDAEHQRLLTERNKNRELRERLRVREEEIAKLVSLNAALEIENIELRALLSARNITPLPAPACAVGRDAAISDTSENTI